MLSEKNMSTEKSSAFRRTAWLCGGALFVSLLNPGTVHGQFGTAAVLTFLQSMQASMQTTMAVPLTAIQGIEQQESDFQQKTVYPAAQITSAQGLASTLQSKMSSMQTATTSHIASTTPGTPESALETSAQSGNVNEIPKIASEYTQVYGQTPPPTAFSNPQEASAIDMGDAQAKDALSKSVQLDAVASQEMGVATQLMQASQNSSAGTAPMVQSQASAWLLQGQAYSQGAMSQLLRTRSAALSYQALDLKNAGVASQNTNQSVQNVIASH